MLKRFLAHSSAIDNVETIKMTEVVIASAAEAPIGAFSGGLGGLVAHDLGEVAIEGFLERAGWASLRKSRAA